MARIVGGIGISHSPSMGLEYDRGLVNGFAPRWQVWFDGTRPVKSWLAELAPTLIVVVYNDHMSHFSFEAYPTLAIGVAETYPQADEGWGTRAIPDLKGDVDFSWQLTNGLVTRDFDLTVCQELKVDHGIYSWVPYLFDLPCPIPIVPIAVNMMRAPYPSSRRMRDLGLAIRAACGEIDREERILVVATGGMSHQISGARFGIANEDLDRSFLRKLPHEMDELVAIPQRELMRLGGTEAAELSMWFSMRAALSNDARAVHTFYTFPQITGCGVLAMEEPR